MARLLTWLAAALGVVGLVLGPATPAPAAGSQVTLYIVEGSHDDPHTWGFYPANVTVPPGTTVTWVNTGQEFHTVVSLDRTTFSSPLLNPGDRWSVTLTKTGSFAYECTVHPSYMKGTLTVQAGAPVPQISPPPQAAPPKPATQPGPQPAPAASPAQSPQPSQPAPKPSGVQAAPAGQPTAVAPAPALPAEGSSAAQAPSGAAPAAAPQTPPASRRGAGPLPYLGGALVAALLAAGIWRARR